MTKVKETAAERRAREAAEARASQEKWLAERSDRLLKAMARAAGLYVSAEVRYSEDELYYRFALSGCDKWEPVSTLEEWTMICIEEELERRLKEEQRKEYLKTVKAELMATLTDEQKEALGL
jgi:hypothetical protein